MFICVFLCSPSVGYVKYIYIYIYYNNIYIICIKLIKNIFQKFLNIFGISCEVQNFEKNCEQNRIIPLERSSSSHLCFFISSLARASRARFSRGIFRKLKFFSFSFFFHFFWITDCIEKKRKKRKRCEEL